MAVVECKTSVRYTEIVQLTRGCSKQLLSAIINTVPLSKCTNFIKMFTNFSGSNASKHELKAVQLTRAVQNSYILHLCIISTLSKY